MPRQEHARNCGNAPSCSSRPELAAAEHAAQAISGSARVLACSSRRTFPEGWGTQRIAFTRRLARAPIAVRETRALPGLSALHHSLLFSVAVTLRRKATPCWGSEVLAAAARLRTPAAHFVF